SRPDQGLRPVAHRLPQRASLPAQAQMQAGYWYRFQAPHASVPTASLPSRSGLGRSNQVTARFESWLTRTFYSDVGLKVKGRHDELLATSQRLTPRSLHL